jgi:hypothetical protein
VLAAAAAAAAAAGCVPLAACVAHLQVVLCASMLSAQAYSSRLWSILDYVIEHVITLQGSNIALTRMT